MRTSIESVMGLKLVHRLTLDTTTDFLFGRSIGSLDNPQVDFAEAFQEVQRVQVMITRLG